MWRLKLLFRIAIFDRGFAIMGYPKSASIMASSVDSCFSTCLPRPICPNTTGMFGLFLLCPQKIL